MYFFFGLNSELCDFQSKIEQKRGNPDPNLLLLSMVNRSISRKNFPGSENYKEAKRMAQETVQKLAEFEKSGFVIKGDIKYEVRAQMASYYSPRREMGGKL